jgi:hypothetical protein
MIRLQSARPLIFESAGSGFSRRGWLAMTLASWGFFLYLLMPAVGSFVLTGVAHLRDPSGLFAFLNDALFSALNSYGKLTGGTLALALGITSLDRLVRYRPVTVEVEAPMDEDVLAQLAEVKLKRVNGLPAGATPCDPLADGADAIGFDAPALGAMRTSQRLLAHHDSQGQLIAVTVFANSNSNLNPNLNSMVANPRLPNEVDPPPR